MNPFSRSFRGEKAFPNRFSGFTGFTGFSAIEICVVLVLFSAALIPIFQSFSAGRRGIVRTENQLVGEQYALELSDCLGIMKYTEATKFVGVVNSMDGSDPFYQSLSPLKEGFKRELEKSESNIEEDVPGFGKRKINFALFKIIVSIPSGEKGKTTQFFLTKLVREEI